MSKYKLNCGPGRTKQSFAKACDINTIMARARQGGIVPGRAGQPMYGDFSKMPTDYQECLQTVINADEAFMQLPAAIRAKFANDPAFLVDWLNDPVNAQEAVSLGLMPAPVATPEKPVVGDSSAKNESSNKETPPPSA